MNWKNRIKEYKIMRAGDIMPNEKNWRRHPEFQTDALKGVLSEVGKIGALLAYYSERNDGKLTLIDGHARSDLDKNEEWPVLITDLTDQEIDIAITTFDSISILARKDGLILDTLLNSINTENDNVKVLLDGLQNQIEELLSENNIFIPNTEPEQGYNEITENDIDKTSEKLNNNFNNDKREIIGACCPKCGYEFEVSK